MTIVVDASVALKWVLNEDDSEAADALLDHDMIAPSLWLIEAANALWRRAARREISGLEAQELLSELLQAPVVTVPDADDLPQALRLAEELAHPVYDCLYLALALRKNTCVVTADARFHGLAMRRPDLAQAILLLGAPA